MMKNRLATTFGALALLAALAGTARATVLNFNMKSDGTVPGNNQDLDIPYGSNVTAANIIGATDGGEGFTPNIALVWAPTGGFEVDNQPDSNVLEYHSAATFTGAGLTVPVLQLDVDLSQHLVSGIPAHPTLDFIPEAGWAVKIFDFQYGNATDHPATDDPHPWTFSILELPSLTPTGSSFTTAALGAGDNGVATFNFTGTAGVSYRLLMDDGDDTGYSIETGDPNTYDLHNPRTGIDNVRFGQVAAAAGTPGDYNDNGKVDAADYVLWRNGGPLLNDPTPGVQPADYGVWKANFGKPPGAASGSALAAVPEPSTLGLIGMLLIGLAAGSLRSVQGR